VPLFWRVVATNALVLVVAAAALVASPATVGSPAAAEDVIVLGVVLAGIVGLNLALLRRAFAPLVRLERFMRGVDLLAPGGRAPVETVDSEVAELTGAFNEMLDRLESERRDSLRRTLAAQEAERTGIARDLHDGIGQELTAVMLDLDRGARLPPGEMRALAEAAKEDLRHVLEELGRISHRLRPEALEHLGLGSALTALAIDTGRRAGIAVIRRIDAPLPALSREAELVVYRIAQEALTNVARHADARRAMVDLRRQDATLVLAVTDDGKGFDPRRQSSGPGLRGMWERAMTVGGRLEVRSRIGAGCAVTLTLDAGA
jgi:two-component system sensor histidine kinase UhpB